MGLRERWARLQGSPVEYDLGLYEGALAAIGALEPELQALEEAALRARAARLREAVRGGAALDAVRDEAFAVTREAARRVLGLRPFDVQVVAALALHRGSVVEMQTGEGKTLAAVMPASLEAFAGRGVHVLTFNDYLARRDAEWMGPIYRALGLTVGWVASGMAPAERRRAYAADVTYVTAREAGFDHLRDRLAMAPEDLVHRPLHFALVDEADSLLVDEARVPLVIAGRAAGQASSARRLAEVVAGLEKGVHFDTDEHGRNVELTERGFERVEEALGCGSLQAVENYALLTELHCALHARALLRRDADYIVRGGKIEIVDEFTGRVVEDRHWPDGLQAALEAKEGLERRAEGRILGSITLQHFLGAYPRLCGMTGTAQDAAAELEEFYGLRLVVIPTHRPMIRADHADVVFTHRAAKEAAVVEEVRRVHASGRPVLVGTTTVEESERLAALLRAAGVPCEVLNAKNDAMEAAIVARAGVPGARHHLHQHGRARHRHPTGQPGRSWPRAGARGRRPLRDRHQPAREPSHRPAAPRPRRAAGRSGRVALLREPGRRPPRALRRGRADPGAPEAAASGRAHRERRGEPGDRAGAADRRGPEPRDPAHAVALCDGARGPAAPRAGAAPGALGRA